MFFKKLKNKIIILILTLLIIPSYVFAYSDYIIAGGENIGIQINSKGVMIVGLYKVNESYPGRDANLRIGDRIISINGDSVNTINDVVEIIQKYASNSSIEINYLRGNESLKTTLNLKKDSNDVLKSGLYVKDNITGIGTLTFIDPQTTKYGALGHEIIEKSSGTKMEVKDGKIYKSVITGINPSTNGNPGEKNAKYFSQIIYGDVYSNTSSGIFGNYTAKIPDKKLYKVADPTEIIIGKAKILTVVKDETVEEFDIQILKVNDNKDQKMKNILFEIIDPELLKLSGGVVQGMSGSPIIQDDKIIGAVTHVVIDNPKQGYGIFIKYMLEEAEK